MVQRDISPTEWLRLVNLLRTDPNAAIWEVIDWDAAADTNTDASDKHGEAPTK